MIPRTQRELEILYNDIFQRAFGLCELENDVSKIARFPHERGANFMETQMGFTPTGSGYTFRFFSLRRGYVPKA